MYRQPLRNSVCSALFFVAVCLLLPSQSALGQADSPRSKAMDKKADEAFRRMSSHLAAAGQMSVKCRIMTDHVLESGLRVQLSRTSNVVIRRPDRLAALTIGDQEDRAVWLRGGKLTLLDRRENSVAEVSVPAGIDEMFDHMAETYGFVVPLCDLLFSDPHKAALAHVWSGVYVGLHDVAGVKCHHLAFRQDGVDWQIWIQEGDQPLPRKVVITYNNLPGTPQFMAFLDDWNLKDAQPDSVFEPQLPAGAKRVELRRMSAPASEPADTNKPSGSAK